MSDNLVRLSVFFIVLLLMAALESLFPRRPRVEATTSRWLTNFLVLACEVAVLRLLGPVTAVGASLYAMDHTWGLLSRVRLPLYIDTLVSFIALDMALYWQHRLSHSIPALWRFHKVHHADRDIDVTTGFRFHPVEAGLSMLYKCIVIFALGPVYTAVVVFEIVLNASAMFNHANLRLPSWLDKVLRSVLVTPDFHRVHHSVKVSETNSNYGFFLSLWDYVFASYKAQPERGHSNMVTGLNEYQDKSPSRLAWCLKVPFQKSK